MQQGTVKFYNRSKAFGFITPDGGGEDVLIVPSSLAQGTAPVTAGQRVSFDTEPGSKGPKAIRLKAESPAGATQQHGQAAGATAEQVTLYYDPEGTESGAILAALKGVCDHSNVIDYMSAPPKLERLKQLSLGLRDHGQSLVRRYHPLFFELQLDDRFLSENDFWTAVMEHPALINGPVVAAGSSARVCKTGAELHAFLGSAPATAKRPKSISPRLVALINGGPLPPEPELPVSEPSQSLPLEPEPDERTKKAARKAPAPRGKETKPALKPKKIANVKAKVKAKPKAPAPKKRKAR